MQLFDQPFSALSARQLLQLLRLRSEIFVVEQHCIYLDIDGRDEEAATRHIWLEHDGCVLACLRLLKNPNELRIGRVVTAPAHRGKGHAARLIEHALDHSSGPWALSAQAQLESWYASFGFRRRGDNYLEDGIPHVLMLRAA